jgi:tetratricopeptide (TPR) repeat protein
MSWFRRPAALVLVLASAALAGDLEDGKALQAAGKFEEALAKLEAASKADPTSADAALALSQVLAGLGRYEAAAKAVDAARKAHPENAALPAAKARAYLLLLEKEKAKETSEDPNEVPDEALVESYREDVQKWAKAAMAVDAKCVEALVVMGLYQQHYGGEGRGNEEQAIINFEMAAAADPRNFDAVFRLGELWFAKAEQDKKNADFWSKADSYFFTALKLDPKSMAAAEKSAHCKAWLKSPAADVVAAYRRALALNPENDKLLKQIYDWSAVDDRAPVFQELVDAAPKNVARRIYFAYALSSPPWNNHDKALEVLDQAASIEPKNAFIPLTQADICLGAGRIDPALNFYEKSVTLFERNIDDTRYDRLAFLPVKTKAMTDPQRDRLWTILWKGFPARAGAANNAGLYYRDSKKAKESLEWYLRAVEAAPDDVCIQNDTGLIYHYNLNELDKAEPHYRKAIALGKEKKLDDNEPRKDPDRGYHDALNNLAILLAKQKKWAELKKFVVEDVPEGHQGRDKWLKAAETKKWVEGGK